MVRLPTTKVVVRVVAFGLVNLKLPAFTFSQVVQGVQISLADIIGVICISPRRERHGHTTKPTRSINLFLKILQGLTPPAVFVWECYSKFK
jgi:hypothetical protein